MALGGLFSKAVRPRARHRQGGPRAGDVLYRPLRDAVLHRDRSEAPRPRRRGRDHGEHPSHQLLRRRRRRGEGAAAVLLPPLHGPGAAHRGVSSERPSRLHAVPAGRGGGMERDESFPQPARTGHVYHDGLPAGRRGRVLQSAGRLPALPGGGDPAARLGVGTGAPGDRTLRRRGGEDAVSRAVLVRRRPRAHAPGIHRHPALDPVQAVLRSGGKRRPLRGGGHGGRSRALQRDPRRPEYGHAQRGGEKGRGGVRPRRRALHRRRRVRPRGIRNPSGDPVLRSLQRPAHDRVRVRLRRAG